MSPGRAFVHDPARCGLIVRWLDVRPESPVDVLGPRAMIRGIVEREKAGGGNAN